eukprot:TRINITY_DN18924_c0_g1_i1.p1 TRINITY_DN18924_c0_g1~~TRINITY_DN18924_c0_g1_i1.p1  ORF type:complete len:213 (+),score=42.36 TRINITY_DN18924_c0_g1_i1:88-639(+)
MGTSETLTRGAIQFMSAGTGIVHSEHNRHPSSPLRFIQMWFTPRSRGLTPRYGSMPSNLNILQSTWAHLVSDVDNPLNTPVKIHQDVNIYVCLLHKEENIPFVVSDNRQAYFLCMEGDVLVEEKAVENEHNDSGVDGDNKTHMLTTHDAAEVKGKKSLYVKALTDGVHLMMVEMSLTNDSRYR